MYKQSNEAKLAYQSAERTLDIVVNVNGVDYKATDIEQFDYDSGGYTGDTFSIGSTYENNITVKFIHLVEGLKRGMIVKPRIGIKLPNGTFEYTPLGVFIIADEIQMDRNNNSTTIKAYDKFVVMEGQYISKLTYPANAVDIITEIAQMCKVDVNTDDLAHLPTIKVSKAITKQSYRTAIGWIAQLYVGFASFDRDGKLTIRRVAEPNYTIEPSEYEQQGLVKNEAPYIIGGISCNVNVVETTNNGETNETTHKLHSGSVNGSQIELTNDIMTQSLLDSIWDSLKSITFYPFSLNWFGNPAIEAGDWLSLKDMKGNVFVVPNNGYTISFNGGLSSTSKADQNATDSGTVKYTGELTRAIENYSRRQAPDGTNIYTDVKEPTDAKFNDVWFKPNGNSTELWIFERQADGSGKWVKQPVNGEVEQKINDALKEFDELDKSFKDNANAQSSTNELMKSRIDSISNQIPNLSDEISRVNGNVTSLKTQTDKDRQQLQTTSQNLDQARQDVLSNSNRIDKLTVDLDSVNINVNNVNSKVDNMQVGGTNLLKGTSKELKQVTTTNDWVRLADTQVFKDMYPADNFVARVWIEKPDKDSKLQAFVRNNGLFRGNIIKAGQSGYSEVHGTLKNEVDYANLVIGAGDGVSVSLGYKELKIEKGNVPTDWSPAPEDEIERVSQLKVDLNGINATVATNKGDIAQIKLTESGMQQSIKDAQGNISTLQNDSKQFKQQFLDVNGNITTIKNDAKSLSSQLSTKVGTSEYNSFKEQTAQELRTKLTASDLNGYAKSADVKVSVDGLNARFDNLNIGGVNLMRNTTRDYVKFTGNGDWGVDYLTPNHQAVDTPVEGGETYTFSAWVKNDKSSAGRIDLEIYQWNANHENKANGSSSEVSVWVSPGEEKRLVFTKTLLSDTTSVRLHTRNIDRDGIVTYWAKMAQVEKGTIATDWSPAPEDTENELQVLSGKITANSNEFSTVYTKITNVQDVVNSDGGGVNLAKNTSNKLADVNVRPWLYVGSSGGNFFNNLQDYQGKYMTVRVWIEKPNKDVWVQIWTDKKTIGGNVIKAGQSGYSTASGIIPTGFSAWNIPVGRNDSGSVTFGWKELKIELGNVATPWTPNPDDVDNNIDTAANNARTNAKNDAINAIKGDSQWQSMGKIVTNASFLQNADGFAQEVIRTATPLVEGGGVNLARGTKRDLQNASVTDTWFFIGGNGISYFNNLSSYQGKHITVRIWIERPTADAWVQIWTNKVTISGNHIKAGQSGYSTASGVIPTGFTDWNIPVGGGAQTMSFGWKELKIELGEVATPWTPAPEDLATKLQLNQVIDTADSHTRTISDYLTGSNSRFVQMANYFNMNVGNSSVSVNGNGVMLEGNRIKITGKTLIDNAVILDALIKDINANTIKTKTLDASKINVTNLNANNITSGTLSGSNFSLNLDKGNMKIGVADKSKSIILDNGKIDLYASDVLSSSDYVGTITTVKGGPANHAIRIAGNDGFLIGTEDFTNNFFADGGYPWGTDPKNYVSGSGIFGYKQNMTIATGPTRDHSTLAMVAGAIPSDNLGNMFGSRAQPGMYIYGRDNAHKDLSFATIAAPLAAAFNTRYGSIGVGNRLIFSGLDTTDTSLDYGKISLTLNAPNKKNPGLSIVPSSINLGIDPDGIIPDDPYFSLRLNENRVFLSANKISITADEELYLRGKPVSIGGDLSVLGSKNAVVPSSKGYIAINAYETAEYYFGDIGESQTDKQGVKIINLDPLFLETVNTSVPYQVFLSSYDDAKVWVFARNNNMFIVKSDKPNVKFAWEIKAKRKDYENVRLKTVDLKNERN